MLGFGLDWWNAAMLISLGLGALAAIAVLVTTRAVIVLQDREAKENAAAFGKYKLEAGERATALETAGKVAQASIAEANARAIEAQLALERFKAPRTITALEQDTLASKLLPFAGTKAKVWMLPTAGVDVASLGDAIIHILSTSKWTVGFATTMSGRTATGVLIIPRTGVNVELQTRIIIEYLNSIGISSSTSSSIGGDNGLEPSSNVSIFAGEPDIYIIIGSKP